MAGLNVEMPTRNEAFTRALFPRIEEKDYGIRWVSSDGTVVDVIGDNQGLRVEIDGEFYGIYPLTDDEWSSVCNALSESTWNHPKWSWQ